MSTVHSQPAKLGLNLDGNSLIAWGLKERAKVISIALKMMRKLLEEHMKGYQEIDQMNRHKQTPTQTKGDEVAAFPSLAALGSYSSSPV